MMRRDEDDIFIMWIWLDYIEIQRIEMQKIRATDCPDLNLIQDIIERISKLVKLVLD